ncbi:MurR/RpiR family transcriptional regulator [Lactiplantibacillus pentosus]|uniref:MurR/RpiR family transcriptional regulator n=1 Tax=Lactiplantibacillus pentosus TaxID=1589 RepID=UPI000C7E7CA2|nr:MurR/RpiR family transcriptional regulator [Lactiplantibacillus pentosus]AUI78035.1 RpiR family transcriptional regulator [Lactiplantibacillus pentosus]MBU7465269.1 MurR/RpiR family transcriptional regulator [Lactiplantibacillus pentosus]MBU7488829.1 MurR/RpiR family transcriptional regulator [Lactiplantibacillus pentosus]MBU7492299.1 MurR/RpiR family transcriptional regulator [Lactiplantibacillus pentosus]MBU7518654.1 MurR/RpiR family transcriptional regulator [Lactiplantibacillus pentosus
MSILISLQHPTDFTSTEERIGAYILAHLNQMPTLRIKDLAAKTYTSHSTIVRLTQKLGYHGFRDFQQALTAEIATQQHQSTTVDANFPFSDNDSVQTISAKMATLTINAIQTAQQQLDAAQLAQAANLLMQANRIFIFAQGDSQLRARSFQNKLVKINRFAIIADEYADEAWNAANLTTEDCAFIISYAGTTSVHQQFATYFADHQIPLLVLTGNPQSPLLAQATTQLLTVQSEYNFAKIGTFASQAAFEYVLDSLFATMYAQDFHANLQNLQAKQQLLQAGPLTTKER